MSLAEISLGALLVVIVCSCTTRVNPGLLSVAFAGIIGVYLIPGSDPEAKLKAVAGRFPAELFLTLVGVTLLFTQAQLNGTLDTVARAAVHLCRGNAGLIPVMFFLLTFAFAAVGAGNIAASALISPMAMAVADRARIPAFLMTIMVAHGSLAGALSPVSPTGIIAAQQMRQIGLGGYEAELFVHNLLANFAVAIAGYCLFGGWRLFRRSYQGPVEGEEAPAPEAPFTWRHAATLALIAALVVAVLFFQVPIGLGAFVASVLLTLARLADEREAMRKVPWGVIVMVSGVTVLTALLDATGGRALFARIVREVSSAETVTGVVGFFSAFVSVYSSTSGVVLPAFLPIATQVGGDPLAVASSIIVAGHLVDSSPLSTIGAICIAYASPREDHRVLFRKVMAWGLSMAVVGAVGCWLFFRPW